SIPRASGIALSGTVLRYASKCTWRVHTTSAYASRQPALIFVSQHSKPSIPKTVTSSPTRRFAPCWKTRALQSNTAGQIPVNGMPLRLHESRNRQNDEVPRIPYAARSGSTGTSFPHLIGSSARFRAAVENVKVVAATDCSVLIRGETGTGKEGIAR